MSPEGTGGATAAGRARRVAVLAIALAGAVVGCAVGPRYAMPDSSAATPAGYATTGAPLSDGAPQERWWEALGDPILDRLVATALADNPDLAAAEASVQQARASARSVGAAFYPQLNADAQLSRDRISRNGENLALIPIHPASTEFTDYRVGVDAAWEIDLAGRTRREVEAALGRLGSAAESRNDARVVVAAEVADGYVTYRAATARLALARRTLETLEETRRLIDLEVRAGVASEEDVERAEADRLAGESAIPTLEASAQGALLSLAALTGESREVLRSALAEPRPVPQVPAVTPVGLPSELLRRRPDVRRAERELAAATADVGSAIAAQFPRLSLVGDFGWDSVRPGELVNAASRYFNLAPQLTLPVLAGGRLRAGVDAARASRDASLASYRSVVLRAFADTETALVQFASEHRRSETLASSARVSAATLGLEQRRARAGDVSTLEVLAAERSVNAADDQSVASAAQLALDYVALGKALGGGWQTPPGLQ